MNIDTVNKNLSGNMLIYALVAILAGIFFGNIWNLNWMSALTLPVVFIMIYPMMVNLSLSSLKRVGEHKKPLGAALMINFVFAPLLMYILTSVFALGPQITLALMLLSIAPVSSMGLGYIGLAEGHMLSGAMITAAAFVLSIFIYPLAGHYLASGANLDIPISLILQNLIVVLVLPLLFGIATREYMERKHGSERFLKLKPYFSVVTQLFLYLLIFVIFASEAGVVLKNIGYIWLLLPTAILFYTISILFTVYVNKNILKLEYGQHQSVVFTSTSKNIALTIAILISVFGAEGQYMAVFPAIMILFQAPFLIIYLKFSHRIKRLFTYEKTNK